MGNESVKGNENMYFQCRKEAARYNDKLNSRESAAYLIGISESSLSDYELGLTKVVPVDKVVLMSDLYNAPQLKMMYCKYECPIGKNLPIATEVSSVEKIAIRLLGKLETGQIDDVKKGILQVAEDGVIDDREISVLKELLNYLDSLSKAIGELRLLCDKCQSGV